VVEHEAVVCAYIWPGDTRNASPVTSATTNRLKFVRTCGTGGREKTDNGITTTSQTEKLRNGGTVEIPQLQILVVPRQAVRRS
jgi:hypothetical protein